MLALQKKGWSFIAPCFVMVEELFPMPDGLASFYKTPPLDHGILLFGLGLRSHTPDTYNTYYTMK